MPFKKLIASIPNSEPFSVWMLVSIWAIIQFIAYLVFGVLTPVDSNLYIESASTILIGEWPTGHDFYYSSYILLLSLLKTLGAQPTSIVLIQILASGVSVYCIFKLTKHFSHNNQTSFIAGLFYILWFKFQQWNLIVYTDSLFVSLSIITIYLLVTAKSGFKYFLVAMLIGFTSLIRPTGILFLISVVVYSLYSLLKAKRSTAAQLSIILASLLLGLILLNEFLRSFVDSFIRSYSIAEIIYPKITFGIKPPMDLYIPSDQDQPIVKIISFIVFNPLYSLKIFALKGTIFLGHTKPYYSSLHNLFIVIFLFPLYIFSINGITISPNRKLKFFMLTFICLQFITVSLTSENWDGRFILSFLPWIFIFSAFGIVAYCQKYFHA